MKIFFYIIILIYSLQTHATENLNDRLVSQLKELVEINSGTSNTQGVDKIQDWISKELKALNFEITDQKDHFLMANLKTKNSKTIVILVHVDTVFEKFSPFQNFKMNADQKFATGPGVADAKGGIVIAIEGLKRFLKENPTKFNIIFISSPSEETGSAGFTEIFRQLGKTAWIILGFEPSLVNGNIIHSRKGDRWYRIKTLGKEAHAGRSHKEGANACLALSEKLVLISKLTNYNENTTVSVGRIEGGKDKYNIVCGEAEAKIDTRFSSFVSRDKMHKKIESIINKNHVSGVTTTYALEDDSPPFSPTQISTPFINQYLSAVQKVENKKIKAEMTGGAADSNYFSHENAIIIDGLGPVGGKMHTTDEYIELQSLETRAEALKIFLKGLSSSD